MDTKQRIIDFITTNFLFDEDKDLSETESLLETGVIDSTGVLELVAFIEETYGFKVEDEEIVPENLDSIVDITAYINAKLAGAANKAKGVDSSRSIAQAE